MRARKCALSRARARAKNIYLFKRVFERVRGGERSCGNRNACKLRVGEARARWRGKNVQSEQKIAGCGIRLFRIFAVDAHAGEINVIRFLNGHYSITRVKRKWKVRIDVINGSVPSI